MKTPLIVFVCFLAATEVARAQVGGVTIDDLRAPTSPAFVLLGVTPAAVERPENPKSFAVNVINKLSTTSGLPQNYALELAPYWLMSHPTLTFYDYQRATIVQSLAQTLSFSVATTPLTAAAGTTDASGTRLGVGVRTNVWNGRPNPKLEELVADLETINGAILDKLRLPGTTRADIVTEVSNASAKALEIQALDGERLGFFLTVAGGQVWNYPADNFQAALTDRWGLWLTPAYRFRACGISGSACDAVLDTIGVVRALHDPGKSTQWDIGGRLLWQPNKELSVSAEALRRSGAAATADTNRTVGIVEYRVKPDMALYASFGKDFANDSGIQPLVSLMGLNVGFGSAAKVAPVTKRAPVP